MGSAGPRLKHGDFLRRETLRLEFNVEKRKNRDERKKKRSCAFLQAEIYEVIIET